MSQISLIKNYTIALVTGMGRALLFINKNVDVYIKIQVYKKSFNL